MSAAEQHASILEGIFNAVFWDANIGAYSAPATREEIEDRFNQVLDCLTAIYEVPARGSDAAPCFRTEGVPVSVVQDRIDAFYVSDFAPTDVEAIGTPIAGTPRVTSDWPTGQAARSALARQLGGAPPSAGVKVSLNVPALERLIGGDSAVEVELRKSIVQEFAKRHLTAVAKELKDEISKEKQRLFDEVFTVYCTKSSWGARTLSSDASALVLSEVKNAIQVLLQRDIQKVVQASFDALQPQLDGKIEAALHQAIATKVHEKVKQQALGALKEVLG